MPVLANVLLGVREGQLSITATDLEVELVAATDDWAERLEELQYTMGEGPGVEAFAHGGPVLVADLADLGPTVARLKSEGVKFLEEIHSWGTTRAAMIEGPDRVAIELVEVR